MPLPRSRCALWGKLFQGSRSVFHVLEVHGHRRRDECSVTRVNQVEPPLAGAPQSVRLIAQIENLQVEVQTGHPDPRPILLVSVRRQFIRSSREELSVYGSRGRVDGSAVALAQRWSKVGSGSSRRIRPMVPMPELSESILARGPSKVNVVEPLSPMRAALFEWPPARSFIRTTQSGLGHPIDDVATWELDIPLVGHILSPERSLTSVCAARISIHRLDLA